MHGERSGFTAGLRGRIRLAVEHERSAWFSAASIEDILIGASGFRYWEDERPSAGIVRIVAGGGVELGALRRQKPLVGLLDAALETHLAEHASRRGIILRRRVAILPGSATGDLHDPALRIVPLSDAWARRRRAVCQRRAEVLTMSARLLLAHILAH